MVERVPMLSRRRIRRAWTADSWTVGIEKVCCSWLGLVKSCFGEGRLEAAVLEIRLRRALDLRYILLDGRRSYGFSGCCELRAVVLRWSAVG